MLECINKECRQYKSGVCPKECDRRIKPTHIPNYAEEQLEYAQDKEIRCYNKECSGNKENQCIVTDRICISRVAELINYEEEYKKLKEENSKLNIRINNQNIVIQEYKGYKKDNEKLRRTNAVSYDEYKERLKKKDEHIRDLNQLIEKKDIKIEKLEKELEEVQGKNKNFLSLVEKDIEGNKKEINRLNTEVACLKAFKEKDNKQIQNLKDAVKKLSEVL